MIQRQDNDILYRNRRFLEKTPIPLGLPKIPDEVRVQERKQKLLSRNLESVFCLSISKSQGEVRKLDSAWRYLDLEICPGSKIRGEARNLDSGWPAPVLGNW